MASRVMYFGNLKQCIQINQGSDAFKFILDQIEQLKQEIGVVSNESTPDFENLVDGYISYVIPLFYLNR